MSLDGVIMDSITCKEKRKWSITSYVNCPYHLYTHLYTSMLVLAENILITLQDTL